MEYGFLVYSHISNYLPCICLLSPQVQSSGQWMLDHNPIFIPNVKTQEEIEGRGVERLGDQQNLILMDLYQRQSIWLRLWLLLF